jgi:hypothetical protein
MFHSNKIRFFVYWPSTLIRGVPRRIQDEKYGRLQDAYYPLGVIGGDKRRVTFCDTPPLALAKASHPMHKATTHQSAHKRRRIVSLASVFLKGA